jgi:hypothetical protein
VDRGLRPRAGLGPVGSRGPREHGHGTAPRAGPAAARGLPRGCRGPFGRVEAARPRDGRRRPDPLSAARRERRGGRRGRAIPALSRRPRGADERPSGRLHSPAR